MLRSAQEFLKVLVEGGQQVGILEAEAGRAVMDLLDPGGVCPAVERLGPLQLAGIALDQGIHRLGGRGIGIDPAGFRLRAASAALGNSTICSSLIPAARANLCSIVPATTPSRIERSRATSP